MAADQYSRLEKLVLEHDYVYMLLFNLIIRHDERLRKDVAEALQLLLQSQARTLPVPPGVLRLLQALLDELLKPAPQDPVEEVMSAHPVGLVRLVS